jgi:hypothetical protein
MNRTRWRPLGGFTYDRITITRHVPAKSGVYAVFGFEVCVYVGESDDICANLLEHYHA